MKYYRLYWFVFLLIFAAELMAEELDISARGLFKNGAILEINGKRRLLKAGKVSPEGVMLISADSKSALISVDGKKKTLTIRSQIGGGYKAPSKQEVRFSQKSGGHYYGDAIINGRTVRFLIDTGATSIAINSNTAASIGLRYKNGTPVTVSTANGYAKAYGVMLAKVRVGTIALNNVNAIVLEGQHPAEVLLGNSFLSRVAMKVEGNVLTLSTKY